MKILKINPDRDENRNCIEDQIVSIAKWWKTSNELMYSEDWGFLIKDGTHKRLGESICPNKGNKILLLEEYHRIKITQQKIYNFNEVMELAQRELLLARPLIISISSFWCPWDKGFEKYDIPHSIIVTGINESKKQVYFTDAFNDVQNVMLSFDYLKDKVGMDCATFELLAKPKSLYNQKAFSTFLYKLIDQGIIEHITEFSQMVKKSMDINLEVKGYEEIWWRAPIFNNITELIKGRIMFSRFLLYINIDKNALIQEIVYEWQIIRGLFIKALHVANSFEILSKISERLCKIAEKEEKIIKELISHAQAFGGTNEM